MRKKFILGLVLTGLLVATSFASVLKVNAADPSTGFCENFATDVSVDTNSVKANHNISAVTNCSYGVSSVITPYENTDGVLKISVEEGATQSNNPKISMHPNGSSVDVYNSSEDSVIIKTKIMLNEETPVYSVKGIYAYFSANSFDSSDQTKGRTVNLIRIYRDRIYNSIDGYTANDTGKIITVGTWHEVVFIFNNPNSKQGSLYEENDGVGSFSNDGNLYAYMDGNFLYKTKINNATFNGQLKEIYIEYSNFSGKPKSEMLIDYIDVKPYKFMTLKAQEMIRETSADNNEQQKTAYRYICKIEDPANVLKVDDFTFDLYDKETEDLDAKLLTTILPKNFYTSVSGDGGIAKENGVRLLVVTIINVPEDTNLYGSFKCKSNVIDFKCISGKDLTTNETV